MELTPLVKSYIEKHIDELNDIKDQESALNFMDNFKANSSVSNDLPCLIFVMQDILGILTDVYEHIANYKDIVSKEYSKLKSLNIFDIKPKLTTHWDETNSWNFTHSELGLAPPSGSECFGGAYQLKLQDNLFLCWRDNGSMYLMDNSYNSVSAHVGFSYITNYSFKFSEFYKKEILYRFLSDYAKYIKDVKDAVPMLMKTVVWKIQAENIAKTLQKQVEKAISDSVAYCNIKLTEGFNAYVLKVTPSVKTKIDLNIYINYDSDPSKIDINDIFKHWAHTFNKFLKLNSSKFI